MLSSINDCYFSIYRHEDVYYQPSSETSVEVSR